MELVHEGEVIVLAVPDAVLGRTSACEIQVSHPLVSRRHCRVEATREGVFVEDLDSANGTFLNGERLRARRSLRPGDVVQIGKEGPRFTLVGAVVEGRDVAGSLTGEDAETMIAGDPRAAALRARISISPDATMRADNEAPTRESDDDPRESPPTTGSIPVAQPIGTGGESLLGNTAMIGDLLSELGAHRERADATREAAPDSETRLPTPVPRAAPQPSVGPTDDAPDETPFAVGDDPNDRTRPAAVTRRPAATAPPAGLPAAAAAAPSTPPGPAPSHGSAPTVRATPAGGGAMVVLGFVAGLLLLLLLGVLTPLGRALHSLAPWAATATEDAR